MGGAGQKAKGNKGKERESERYGWSGSSVRSDLFAVNLLNV